MNEQIMNELLKRLDKLGEAGQHTWPILVRGTVMEGYWQVGIAGAWFVGFLISLAIIWKSIKEGRDKNSEFDSDDVIPLFVTGFVGIFICTIFCIAYLHDGFMMLNIPEKTVIDNLIKLVAK